MAPVTHFLVSGSWPTRPSAEQIDRRSREQASFRILHGAVPRTRPQPPAALERDLDLVEHLDHLGYDEAWFGEHHSAGSEIIASPEIMIAAASQRAKRIRFGTGVTSLSYHNPL